MKDSYKIVTLGSPAAGKTSIMHRYINDSFDDYQTSTIGAAFMIKKLGQPDGSTLRLDLWDCAGDERFDSITPIYYRGAEACIVVYDITSRQSYDRAKRWVTTLLESQPENKIIAFVGNKSDLEQQRVISTKEAQDYAKNLRLITVEVSAKNGINIEKLFNSVVIALHTQLNRVEEKDLIVLSENRNNPRSSSCCNSVSFAYKYK